DAQTVNGGIQATATAAAAGQSLALQSVNGTIALTLAKDARVDFPASTMNGSIASSFPLPVRALPASGRAGRGPRGRSIVVQDEDGGTSDVDVEELEREIEQSMKEAQEQAQEAAEQGAQEQEEARRDAQRQIRHVERQIHIVDPRREYTGSLGKGGASIEMTTLNGTVLL